MALVATDSGGLAVDSELALLGAFIESANARKDMGARVNPEDLSDAGLRRLYRIILDMDGEGKAVDRSTVRSELSSRKLMDAIGGELRLRQCLEACPDPRNAAEYAEYVRLEAAKRRIQDTVRNASSPGELLTAMDSEAGRLRKSAHMKRDRGMDSKAMAASISQSFMGAEAKEAIFGYPPELESLNRLTGGIRRGEFVIEAAKTNRGKTVSSVQKMLHWCRSGLSVLYVNCEMPESKMQNLLLKMLTGLEYQTIEQRDIDHQATIMDAVAELSRYRYEILKPRVWSPGEIAMIQAREGFDVVIFDHINRVGSEPHVLADASRDLRTIALEYHCAVLCLQQLNDWVDARDAIPTLKDLRGTKTTGEEADQVLILHREESFGRVTDEGTLRVAKSRVSQGKDIPIKFDRKFLRFEEVR